MSEKTLYVMEYGPSSVVTMGDTHLLVDCGEPGSELPYAPAACDWAEAGRVGTDRAEGGRADAGRLGIGT